MIKNCPATQVATTGPQREIRSIYSVVVLAGGSMSCLQTNVVFNSIQHCVCCCLTADTTHIGCVPTWLTHYACSYQWLATALKVE